MNNYWSSVLKNLNPYIPGEQPKINNIVKLNTNENPYGPSPRVLDAIKSACNDNLKLYPDPDSIELRKKIALMIGNLSEKNVFIGNGSDEILAHTFLAFLKHEKPLFFPDITYSFYSTYCKLYNISYIKVPLNQDFQITVSDYLPEKHNRNIGGIIFPNPNAPTGCSLSINDIELIVSNNQNIVVVIDEAYVDFGTESAVKLVNKYENLLIIQTMSKSRSLAGLRIGFAIGNPNLIDGLERVKNSFNSYPVDRLASIGAIAAIEDHNYFQYNCNSIIKLREKLISDIRNMGFYVLPSKANFIFTKHDKFDATFLMEKLKSKGIIVRHFNENRINQYLRISIGTYDQLSKLIYELDKIVNQSL